jgi:hypothetical protein
MAIKTKHTKIIPRTAFIDYTTLRSKLILPKVGAALGKSAVIVCDFFEACYDRTACD